MPWKNGLGITEEILRFPFDSDDFDWRISRAIVTGSGKWINCFFQIFYFLYYLLLETSCLITYLVIQVLFLSSKITIGKLVY